MRTFFIILMILAAVAIVAVALLNNDLVTINFLLDQVTLNLSIVIIGAAVACIVVMIFFMIYRGIHNYVKAEESRSFKRELQSRVKLLENEKSRLEVELSKLQQERELAAEKYRSELEAEKKKLEEELNHQQQERAKEAAREQAELELEKSKLEEELQRQIRNQDQPATEELRESEEPPAKKGFFGFLKK